MVVRKEFSFPAANGGHDIYACLWFDEDAQEYKAVVELIHGMEEHILRYQGFAVFLAQQGFVVCGHDLAGHGRSVETQEDLGYFGQTDNSWKYLIYDINYLVDFMKKRYEKLPYFIIGHSMGSFLAREFAAEYGEKLSGAVFLGTSGGNPLLDAAIALSKEGIKHKGIKEKGIAVQKMAFGAFNLKCIPKRTPYDWLCSDDQVVDRFIADEKCGFLFTNGGFRDLFQLLKTVSSPKWAKRIDTKLPMLLVSGTDDPVGEYGKGVKRVYQGLLDAGCNNVSMKLYEGDRHEVLNEKNNYTVYRFLLRWLNEQIE